MVRSFVLQFFVYEELELLSNRLGLTKRHFRSTAPCNGAGPFAAAEKEHWHFWMFYVPENARRGDHGFFLAKIT